MMEFDRFLAAVKQQLQPEGRALHLAAMLQQLLACLPAAVTLTDLLAGWQMLACPHSEYEQAAVTHRRKICGELAAIAARETSAPGNLAGAVKTWQAWQNAFQMSADPRQAAMVKIFARELVELRSAP